MDQRTREQRAAESEAQLPARPYALYLRSFGDTGLYYSSPEEMALAQALSPAAEMIEIAEPGLDKKGPAWRRGATRLPVDPATSWQPRVASLMPDAQLVIIRAAGSPGVLWELEEAQRALPPARLVLFISPAADYSAIKRACDPHLRVPLPACQSKESHFIEFDEAWRPQFVPAKISKLTRGMYALDGAYKIMRCELGPVFKRLGLSIAPPLTNRAAISAIGVAICYALALGGLVLIIWMFWYSRRNPR